MNGGISTKYKMIHKKINEENVRHLSKRTGVFIYSKDNSPLENLFFPQIFVHLLEENKYFLWENKWKDKWKDND